MEGFAPPKKNVWPLFPAHTLICLQISRVVCHPTNPEPLALEDGNYPRAGSDSLGIVDAPESDDETAELASHVPEGQQEEDLYVPDEEDEEDENEDEIR